MKAAVVVGADQIEISEVPLPEVPEGWALIRTEFTGLCGTDFSILHGTHPRATFPLIMGHEISGVVVRAGDGGPEVGARIVAEPLISCGLCRACRSGNTHVCEQLGLYGIDTPGSLAEFVALPASTLIEVDASAPREQVALIEPLAVAVHAVERSGLRGGESVALFGAGPIGVLTALVAQHRGAASVVIVEPSAERRAVAERLGLATIPPELDAVGEIVRRTGGAGADIVFDTAAHPSVAPLLAASARVLGTIVLVGVYKKPAEMDLQRITFSENTIVGTRVYTREDMEAAASLVEQDVLGLGRLPVSVYPLEQAAEAFSEATSAGAALKVLVSSESSA